MDFSVLHSVNAASLCQARTLSRSTGSFFPRREGDQIVKLNTHFLQIPKLIPGVVSPIPIRLYAGRLVEHREELAFSRQRCVVSLARRPL